MITADLLRTIMPRAGRKADVFAGPLAAACEEFQIATPTRTAAFLAQIAHESGQLQWVAELASGAAYDNRADLGNTKADAIRIAGEAGVSSGRYWKGHGLIQITGYDNHVDTAEYFEIPILRIVGWLQTPEGASRSAARFWDVHGLNPLADAGYFETITRKINGGTNVIAERLAFWNAAKAALGVP